MGQIVSKFPAQVPDFIVNYPSSKEKMFKWRGKRHGLWPFACNLNCNTWKFFILLCPLNARPWNELYLIVIEGGCFIFIAFFYSLSNSCSCMLCGQQLFCENGKISAATFYSLAGDWFDTVKPKNRTTQSQKNLHSIWRPFFPLFLNFTIWKKSSFLPLAGLDTSNSSSYFWFKCPTGQGSNFPPTERPFWSNSPPSWVRTSVKCPWVVREGGVVETSDWSVH